jgi:hypothetical protein
MRKKNQGDFENAEKAERESDEEDGVEKGDVANFGQVAVMANSKATIESSMVMGTFNIQSNSLTSTQKTTTGIMVIMRGAGKSSRDRSPSDV